MVKGSLKEIKPTNWCLSNDYLEYLDNSTDESSDWTPDQDYYFHLVQRLVDSILNIVCSFVHLNLVTAGSDAWSSESQLTSLVGAVDQALSKVIKLRNIELI